MIIRPVANLQELERLFAESKDDLPPGKHLIVPTHIVSKDGEIRGAISVLPTVLMWMHSKRNTPRDSLRTVEIFENHLAMSGTRFMCAPCHKDSPYWNYMEKTGYSNIGEQTLFVKGF